MFDQKYTYAGHDVEVVIDREPDNAKADITITKPNGQKISAPLSPYDDSRAIVELYIDLGCPALPKKAVGPYNLDDLIAIRRLLAKGLTKLPTKRQY